jgi:FkbM family methyltransferase
LQLARLSGDAPCRVPVGKFEVASVSAKWLAYLHREIFVDLSYYFRASREDPVIVDGGSNIGVAVIFFKSLYPNSRVLAFEPAERIWGLLRENTGALPGVELYQVALGRENGTVSFYEEQDDPGSLMQSTRSSWRLRCPQETAVEQRRLSEFISDDVELVKLDIEGAETAVIEDLSESGKMELVRQLIIEYHHQLDPNRDHVGAFLELLRSLGFRYQLSAHIGDRDTSEARFQDILVHAWRSRTT